MDIALFESLVTPVGAMAILASLLLARNEVQKILKRLDGVTEGIEGRIEKRLDQAETAQNWWLDVKGAVKEIVADKKLTTDEIARLKQLGIDVTEDVSETIGNILGGK